MDYTKQAIIICGAFLALVGSAVVILFVVSGMPIYAKILGCFLGLFFLAAGLLFCFTPNIARWLFFWWPS
jgi:hypothetical protein